jgi:hypothetical protein
MPPPLNGSLAGLVTAAAADRFPAADGRWTRVAPWRPGLEAVISFTGHAVFAVQPDIPDHLLDSLGADGFGGAHDPRLITALAGPHGWIDSLDILMAAQGTGRRDVPPALVCRPDLAGQPRAVFAARIRAQPRIMGYSDPRLRALLTAGFTPLGSLQLFRRAGHDPAAAREG